MILGMAWKNSEAPHMALVLSVQVDEEHNKQMPRDEKEQELRWRYKAMSEGSKEGVLDVSAILTLTFESVIGFLAILWSSCGNL